MTIEKPKPKQLRPITLVTTLIESVAALWAFTVMRHHWLIADGPLPAPFWGAAALASFAAGLVLANGVGILQTLNRPNRRRSSGSRLAVRLCAVEEPHQEIMVGLLPLIMAFGLPVYPLINLIRLNWLNDMQLIWIGLALIGAIISLACSYIIVRQVYLLLLGGKTIVEISHETILPGYTIQVLLAHRSGRLPTHSVEAKLVCRQIVRQKIKKKSSVEDKLPSYMYVATIIYEETLGRYHDADIQMLTLDSEPITTTIPDAAYFSTVPGEYPAIEWQFEVKVKVSRGPDFKLIFPFDITEKTGVYHRSCHQVENTGVHGIHSVNNCIGCYMPPTLLEKCWNL